MTGRLVGALVVLALLGGAGGYVVATARAESDVAPTTFASPAPVPAADPRYPIVEYVVTPDPTTAALPTDLSLHTAEFEAGGFTLEAPVPNGWRRVGLSGGTQWNFSDPANPPNTYVLRIGIVAGDRRSAVVETMSRITALEAQENDGNSENLIIEQQDDSGFTASLIDVGGYRRISIERFLTFPGNLSAHATIAITGREVDRGGMTDLIARVAASTKP